MRPIAHYRRPLEIKPDYAEAHNNLGNALAARGQVDEAIVHYRKALEIMPDLMPEAHYNLGAGVGRRRAVEEAVTECRKALDLARQQNKRTLAEPFRPGIGPPNPRRLRDKLPLARAKTTIQSLTMLDLAACRRLGSALHLEVRERPDIRAGRLRPAAAGRDRRLRPDGRP